jgi:hypothetical protein
MPSNFQNTREFVELVIPNGSTTSTAYELGGTHLIGVLIPSAFTGVKLFVEGSLDNITFYQLYGSSSGTAKEIKVAPNKFIEIESNYDNPFNFIRLVSSSAEAGERKIKIICNP